MHVQLYSVITCPKCGHSKRLRMPTESCLFYYVCEHCQNILKPEPGDCCVFCSYGSVPCPSVQMREDSR